MPKWFRPTSGRCEGAWLSAAEVKVAERDLLVLVVDMYTRYSSSRSSENSEWKQLCGKRASRGRPSSDDVIDRIQASSLPSGTGYFASVTRPRPGGPKPPKTEQLAGSAGGAPKDSCLPPSLTRSLITSYEQHVRNEPRQGRRSVDRVTARLLAPRLSPSPHLAPHPTDRVTDLRRVRSLTCRPRIGTDSGRVEPA